MHNARDGRLDRQAAIIAGQCHRAMCRAMIGAIARQDLVPSRIEAGDLDGVLVRFRAAQVKNVFFKSPGVISASFLPSKPRGSVAMPGAGKGQLRGLILNCLHHLRMLMPNIGVHQLRGKIEIALSVCIPEINSLRLHQGMGFTCP